MRKVHRLAVKLVLQLAAVRAGRPAGFGMAMILFCARPIGQLASSLSSGRRQQRRVIRLTNVRRAIARARANNQKSSRKSWRTWSSCTIRTEPGNQIQTESSLTAPDQLNLLSSTILHTHTRTTIKLNGSSASTGRRPAGRSSQDLRIAGSRLHDCNLSLTKAGISCLLLGSAAPATSVRLASGQTKEIVLLSGRPGPKGCQPGRAWQKWRQFWRTSCRAHTGRQWHQFAAELCVCGSGECKLDVICCKTMQEK